MNVDEETDTLLPTIANIILISLSSIMFSV